jgi:hypothetical protein
MRSWRVLTGLALAWRAIWWRRGLSAAVLAVSTVVVAVAVVGPTYDRAAKESVLQDALRSAPPLETGFEVTSSGPVAGLQIVVSSALKGSHGSLYGHPIAALESPYTGPITCSRAVTDILSPCVAQVTGLVVARDGVPDHVTVTAGRFPRVAGEAIVSTAFLASARLHVGDRITPQGSSINADPRNSAYSYTPKVPHFTALTIVGTYSTDELAGYWFQRPYFTAQADNAGDSVPYQDAIFTVPATFSNLQHLSVIDVPLDVHRVRIASAPGLDRTAQQLKSALAFDVIATQLPAVLDQAVANEDALSTPVLLIVLQLLLLCGLVLFGSVRAAADARGPEIALAKLRRFAPRSVLVFGLAEPLLLVPLALPLGLALGWLTTLALARGQLLPGTPVALPWLGIGAGALAVAAAALATVGVGIRIATRPAGAQWRRADHRPRSRPWWIDLVVLAAAVAGLVAIAATGGLNGSDNTSSASSASLAAPALLALAIAMVGSRLLPWTCRRLYRRTERGGFAGFLAVRQIARRPTTLAVTVLLAVALALATFAVSAYTVAQANRYEVAATTVGAAEVVHVQPPPGSDLGTLVDQADPSGRQAMAVTTSPAFAPDKRLLIGVQPTRLASVATWRGDFAGGTSLADVARALTVSGLHPVTVTGSQLAVGATVSGLSGAPVLRLSATVVEGGSIYLLTGPPLPPGGTVRSVLTLPACSQGCRLSALGVSRDDDGTTDLRGDVVVNALQQRGSGGWTEVPGALRGGASGWRAVVPDAPGYSASVAGRDRLDFRFHLPYQQPPELSVYDVPAALPVAATGDIRVGSTLTAGGLDEQQLSVRTAVRTRYLPQAQANGFLVDRTLAIRSAVQVGQAQQEVWLAKGADPAILQRLQARGVVLGQIETTAATEASLSRQGPPLALALFRIGAVVAAILALGGTALTLALGARRRGFELAALLAQGITRRSLFRSIAAEQGVLLGYGTLLGAAAGLLGAVLALPSVPEFVTAPLAPQLLYQPPYLLVVLIVVGLGVLITAGALVGSAALVRSVDPDRLREYAP